MLEVKELNGYQIASLADTDRLTATIATEIKSELTNQLDGNTNLVINLSNIKFIDSTGIGVLISALKTARQNNGSFKLCEIQKDVMSLLTLMKLDKVFDIIESEADIK
ncbi:STAS domain-containing protein [Carboxylicivirga caseinilyticus]|uniref:STAS domain-containing protein n=1 Tax=Carboxylicivirga caseinilyticus TaxID=3417572 RepID=UPI002AA6525C|nr:STAS domain-containing protein [uncultured Carboxylicivirga sp.]MCU4164927.1 STAS domain-containing protein [Marinilabiliaceae bacterium A049]